MTTSVEVRAREFEALRPLLFSIAYRILGSVGEAEDAVQESWLRFEGSPTPARSARAFLSTAVTRISIDVLRSARVRRERYTGPWLPEPLLDDPYQDPARAAELAESISVAALLLLERLSPLERAVFVLRDVFDYGFPEVAEAVGRSESACRQLAVRARRHMAAARPRFAADLRVRDELTSRFFDAFRAGDVGALRDLLAADVALVNDGGGRAPLAASEVVGRDGVLEVVATLAARFATLGVTAEPRTLNGQPGAVFRDRGGLVLSTMTLRVDGGRITAIHGVVNPDKLGHLGTVADAWALRRRADDPTRQRREGGAPS